MLKQFLERGYITYSVKENIKLKKLLNRFYNFELFKNIEEVAVKSKNIDDTDPTSFGFQIFSRFESFEMRKYSRSTIKNEEKIIKNCLKRVSGFGDESLKEKVTTKFSNLSSLRVDEIENGSIEDSMNQICHEFNVIGINVLYELILERENKVNDDDGTVNSEKDKRDIINDFKEYKHENETLINFFTSKKLALYEHTDQSVITLLAIPELWNLKPSFSIDNNNNDNVRKEEKLVKGITIQNPNTEEWEDLEHSLIDDKIVIIPGDHINKLLMKYGINEKIPATIHRVSSKNRIENRKSIAHFLFRPCR